MKNVILWCPLSIYKNQFRFWHCLISFKSPNNLNFSIEKQPSVTFTTEHIYALNHYFLKERPHLSKNDDAMLIMTVFNLYSLLAITIFFGKPLPYFTSNEQLTDEALEQCINIFFFQRELFSVTGRSACVKQGSDIWWFGPLCYA